MALILWVSKKKLNISLVQGRWFVVLVEVRCLLSSWYRSGQTYWMNCGRTLQSYFISDLVLCYYLRALAGRENNYEVECVTLHLRIGAFAMPDYFITAFLVKMWSLVSNSHWGLFYLQCIDSKCQVQQHISCVIFTENPMDSERPPVFYCETCRIERADPYVFHSYHFVQSYMYIP